MSGRIVHGDDQSFSEDPERLVDAADLRGMQGIEILRLPSRRISTAVPVPG
jgi:hypothetical protein